MVSPSSGLSARINYIALGNTIDPGEYNTAYLALRCTKNSAAGPDLLPGRFYRSLVADFAPSLSIIFQQSFYSSNISDM